MLAPDPVSVVLPPVHIEGLPAVAVTVGEGFTVITAVPVTVQPVVVRVFVNT